MIKKITTLPVAILLLSASTLASADITSTVTFATDYSFRGISQTDRDPALQADLMYGHESGFYAGLWASNVDFDVDGDNNNIDDDIELDVMIGISRSFGSGMLKDVTWDLMAVRYTYPSGSDTEDYNEYHFGLSFDVMSGTSLSLAVDYSDDVFGSDEDQWYYSAGVDYALPSDFGLSLGVGYSDFDSNVFGNGVPSDYVDWKVGVSKSVMGIDLALEYVGTSSNADEMLAGTDGWEDDRFIFYIGKTFTLK